MADHAVRALDSSNPRVGGRRASADPEAESRVEGAASAKTGPGPSTREINVTPVTFRSHGAPVEALLYRSRELEKGAPALVVSTGAGRNLKALEWLSLPMAQRGYVVLTQRYRDSATRRHLQDEEDIGSAISYLEDQVRVDIRRVGIAGHSRGASASLRAAAKDDRVRSTAALNGPTDYARWMRGVEHYSPRTYASAIQRYGGTPDENPEYYRAIAPLTYAAEIRTPVLIVQGESDLRTPPDHAQWMYDALIKTGNARVTLEMLPGLGHVFETDGGYGFDRVVAVVGEWFAETL